MRKKIFTGYISQEQGLTVNHGPVILVSALHTIKGIKNGYKGKRKKRKLIGAESVVWFFKGIGNKFLDGLDIGRVG